MVYGPITVEMRETTAIAPTESLAAPHRSGSRLTGWIAAVVVMRILWGRPAADRYLKAAVLRWRVGWPWMAAALLANVAVWLVALALAGGWSGEVLDVGTWFGLLPSLLFYVVLAVPEEVGWRGFAQLHLRTRHSALVAALVVGALWSLWPLPLRLNPDSVTEGSSQLAWVVATVAAAVLLTGHRP